MVVQRGMPTVAQASRPRAGVPAVLVPQNESVIPVVVDVLAHVLKTDGAASDKFSDMQSPVI